MLKKVQGSTETYRHYCDNKNTAYIDTQAGIYLIDVHVYMDCGTRNQPITYCPYCGMDVEKEEIR